MIGERLSGIYTALEDRYYGVLDFLDAKGVPVYSYNDFLESKGLPAFPITAALIILIAALLFGVFFVGNQINPAITVSFQDQFDQAVTGVTVSVKGSAGNVILSPKTIKSGDSIQLQGIPIGSELTISAEKEGYEGAEEKIVVTKEKISVPLQLNKQVVMISGRLQVVDTETQDPVKGASITAQWQSITRSATSDAEGKAAFAGIPKGTEIYFSIRADGYEPLDKSISFEAEGSLQTAELSPGSANLAGKTRLLVTVLDEAGEPVKGAIISVKDRGTDNSIDEKIATAGEALFDVTKGTSVRLVVQKEGFLRYDSLETEESRTLRLDNETWIVVLGKGGSRLAVTVYALQTPLSDAAVQLFDLNANLVDSGTSGFGGTVDFNGLAPKEYYLTAYRAGYLPNRIKVNIAETEAAAINLTAADAANSARLGVSALDSYKAMANNVDLIFYEKDNSGLLPLGVPPAKTDISGYTSITAPMGKTVHVEAKRGGEQGSGEKTVEANKANEIVIELSKSITIVELDIFDSDGKPAKGWAAIESLSGELLYDGNITDGKVFFDAQGNSKVNLTVKTDDGRTLEQQVDVKGKSKASVSLGEQPSGLAPEIKFTGITNESGEKTGGITPDAYYWLNFETNWPGGTPKGGVHVRVGSDDTAFVDSEEAGAMGFDAKTSAYFFGLSYHPAPAPGNESADKQNRGIAGELSKLVELYFTKPANTVAFKVKIMAKKSITASEIEVHYRAWAEIGGKYYRAPADSDLDTNLFVSSKTALYAETIVEKIPVLSGEKISCDKNLCADYLFVLPNGLFAQVQDFKPVTEELYSLQIELTAKKAFNNATIKLDTDKAAPKLYFTGYDVDNFSDRPTATIQPLAATANLSGQGYLNWPAGSEAAQTAANPLGFSGGTAGTSNTSLTISGQSVTPEKSKVIRVYFKPFAEGASFIKVQTVADNAVLNEQFNFSIERNRGMLLGVSPEEPGVGQDFTIKVLDRETGSGVQNAVVQLKNRNGEIAGSLVGSGSTKKGLNGEYFFRNTFNPGIYTAEVSAQGYKSEKLEIAIARDGILTIKSPIKIDIKKEEREKAVNTALHNTGKEEVNGLAYEIQKESGFPEEFTVNVTMPMAVAGNQDATATIRVSVDLSDESEDNLYGEADLIVKGMVAGNYPTKTTARLVINYNKKLDEACLKFDKSSLGVTLVGRAGSTGEDAFEAENTCETALSLRAKIKQQQADPNITVTVQDITLEKGASATVTVQAVNRIERYASMNQTARFNITFESSQLAKSIPLEVRIWNPNFGISYPPNVNLWLAQAQNEQLAYAQSPFQIMNMGAVPITGFRAALTPEAYTAGITAGFRPNEIQGITLPAGQPVTPMRYVYAETGQAQALQAPGRWGINFIGVVMGRQYPELGKATLTANYTGNKCLEIAQVEGQPLEFRSKETAGTLQRPIKITNKCGEPVRLTGKVLPEKIGNNSFTHYPPDVTMAPGQSVDAQLMLIKGQQINRDLKIRVVGLLTMQNKWVESNELQASLRIGAGAYGGSTNPGKATKSISLKKCDSEGDFRSFQFPILSSDCANGYCDAKQLAAYIIKKADNLIGTVKDKATRARNQSANFAACSDPGRNYCSFDDMGVIAETFPAFLMVDNMSAEVLDRELDETSKTELKTYAVKQGEKAIDDIGSIGFDFGQIYLGGNFLGCGLYYVTILGAVQASNGEIMAGDSGRSYVLTVNISREKAAPAAAGGQPSGAAGGSNAGAGTAPGAGAAPETAASDGRINTDQCLHKVENAANFLPLDEGYDAASYENYRAWPGIVSASGEFTKIGELFAKEWFKKSEGRVSGTIGTSTNRLVIAKGDVKNGLLKIKVKNGENSEPTQPKTVYAYVPDQFDAVKAEIAKALGSFKAYNFNTAKDCWGEDSDGVYIVMRSYENVDELYGALTVSGAGALKINTQEQCADLNVSSGAQEEVALTTDFLEKRLKTGIDYIAFYSKNKDGSKGKIVMKENANGAAEGKDARIKLIEEKKEKGAAPAAPGAATPPAAGTPGTGAGTAAPAAQAEPGAQETGAGVTAMLAAETAKKQYKAELLFCAKGTAEFPLAVENVKEISVTAHSELTPDRKSKPFTVKIEACGIHPIELVKKMAEVSSEELRKGDKEYYATVGWKGTGRPDDTVSLIAIRKWLAVEYAKDEMSRNFVAGEGAQTSAELAFKQEQASKMLWSTASFFGMCMIVPILEGVVGGFLAQPTLIKDAITTGLYTCSLPSIIAARNATRLYGKAWEAANNVIDTVTKIAAPLVMALSFLGGGFKGLMTTAPAATSLMVDSFTHDVGHLTPDELVARSQSFKGTIVDNPGFVGGWVGKMLVMGEDAGTVISASNVDYLAGKYKSMITIDPTKVTSPILQEQILDEMEKSFKSTLRANVGKKMGEDVLQQMGSSATSSISAGLASDIVNAAPAVYNTELQSLQRTGLGAARNAHLDDVLPLAGDNTAFRSLAEGMAGAKPAMPPTSGRAATAAWAQYTSDMAAWNGNVIAAENTLVKSTTDEILTKLRSATGKSDASIFSELGIGNRAAFEATFVRTAGTKAGAYGAVRGSANFSLLAPISDARQIEAAQGVFKKVVEENSDVKKMISPKVYGDPQLKTFGDKLKNIGGFLRANWRSLAGNLLLGIGSGIIADYLGSLGHELYWKSSEPIKQGAVSVSGAAGGASEKTLLNRPIVGIEQLRNGKTYRITASIDIYNRISFRFFEVPEADFPAMAEDLKKHPEKEWKGDCKMFANRPAPQAIGDLFVEEKDQLPRALKLAYYDNVEAIYGSSRSYDPPIEEWIIMAVLGVDPSQIQGCAIPKQWYLEPSKEKRSGWIGCAVRQIKALGPSNVYSKAELKNTLNEQFDAWKKTAWNAKVGG